MIGIRSEKKIGSILMQNNKQKTLILGGAASGKSQYAESLVKVSKQKKFYLASANIYDKEMLNDIILSLHGSVNRKALRLWWKLNLSTVITVKTGLETLRLGRLGQFEGREVKAGVLAV
jgi:hypothetical protein